LQRGHLSKKQQGSRRCRRDFTALSGEIDKAKGLIVESEEPEDDG
jgi:hypothetical protein